jgi:hypothetical protein
MRPSLQGPQHEAHTGQGSPEACTRAATTPQPIRPGAGTGPVCTGPGERFNQPTTEQQVTRHRPGSEERRVADEARAQLARAVVQGRIDDARRLAQQELARQHKRDLDQMRGRR